MSLFPSAFFPTATAAGPLTLATPDVSARQAARWHNDGAAVLEGVLADLGGLRAFRTGQATEDAKRAALERIVGDGRAALRRITADLIARPGAIATWQRRMANEVMPRFYAGTMALSGTLVLPPADRIAVRERVIEQLAMLDRFRQEIVDPQLKTFGDGTQRWVQKLDGSAEARAAAYAGSVWSASYNTWLAKMEREGFEEAKRILGPAEKHCRVCPAQAKLGWQPIANILPIGDSPCSFGCRCHIEIREIDSAITPKPKTTPKPVAPPPTPSASTLSPERQALLAQRRVDREVRHQGRVEIQRAKITRAHETQRAANAEEARANPAYAILQAKNPDLLPPGPIADRIGTYTVGEAKVAAIKAVGNRYQGRDADLRARREQVRAETASHAERLAEIEKQLRGRKATPEERIRLKADREILNHAIEAGDAREARLILQRQTVQDRRRRDIEDLLAVEAPQRFDHSELSRGELGSNTKIGPLSDQARATVAEARRFMSRIVRVGDNTEAPLSARIGQQENSRPYYEVDDRVIRIDPRSPASVVAHEIGHQIEYQLTTDGVPLKTRSHEFLNYRVGDEPAVDLRDKFGGTGFGEKGRKDKFDAAFTEYEAYYLGKDYGPGRGTELLSMGVERIYQDAPSLAEKDPELFKFIVGSLDSSLR